MVAIDNSRKAMATIGGLLRSRNWKRSRILAWSRGLEAVAL
jgi:hypothetical protein